eukprot:g4747.t1
MAMKGDLHEQLQSIRNEMDDVRSVMSSLGETLLDEDENLHLDDHVSPPVKADAEIVGAGGDVAPKEAPVGASSFCWNILLVAAAVFFLYQLMESLTLTDEFADAFDHSIDEV